MRIQYAAIDWSRDDALLYNNGTSIQRGCLKYWNFVEWRVHTGRNHERFLIRIRHLFMSSRPVQQTLSPVLPFLFGPLLRPRARRPVTRAATLPLHRPSSNGARPSPMSIPHLWIEEMSFLR